jgi:hypothetical protein
MERGRQREREREREREIEILKSNLKVKSHHFSHISLGRSAIRFIPAPLLPPRPTLEGIEPGVVVFIIPVLGRLRQEDCQVLDWSGLYNKMLSQNNINKNF